MMSYTFIKHGIKVKIVREKGAFLKWLQSSYDKLLEGSFKKKKQLSLSRRIILT
jgi:hypothetical protein